MIINLRIEIKCTTLPESELPPQTPKQNVTTLVFVKLSHKKIKFLSQNYFAAICFVFTTAE